jgi:hypothetical protein
LAILHRPGEVPELENQAITSNGNEARLISNAVVIFIVLYFFGRFVGFERAIIAAVIAAVCFVIFNIYTIISSVVLQKFCRFTYVDFEIEKSVFPRFIMKPPPDPMSYSALYTLFLGEILLSFVPAVISIVLLFTTFNLWFAVAAAAMINWALQFCFKVEGNLSRFGRFKILARDYTSADIIGRTILIGYKLRQGERCKDMDRLLFIAPNKPVNMYDYRQMVYAYSYSLETGDYKRVLILTDLLSGELPKGIAGITERHCITADRLLAMILSDAPIADIKKIYADNRTWLLENYSNQALNMRCQIVLFAYIKIILGEKADKAAAENASERFWNYSERCKERNLVSVYAEKLLEIENKSKDAAEKINAGG